MPFDEVRFGSQRTLNLREGFTAPEAVRRAESWLREHQIKGSLEVLLITGRGNHSIGGMPVIKPAVEKLLFSLRRRGVVASHRDHSPGAFAVELAPIRALSDAPHRKREPSNPPARPSLEIQGLGRDTTGLLRDLAERSLDELGITSDEAQIGDEMQRQLGLLLPALPTGPQMEEHLQAALRAAIAEYD
jgi:hypothetical protein